MNDVSEDNETALILAYTYGWSYIVEALESAGNNLLRLIPQ